MSGVNWMRENVPSTASARVRITRVLARPGTPSSRMWPPASMPEHEAVQHVVLADQDLADLGLERGEPALELGDVFSEAIRHMMWTYGGRSKPPG